MSYTEEYIKSKLIKELEATHVVSKQIFVKTIRLSKYLTSRNRLHKFGIAVPH